MPGPLRVGPAGRPSGAARSASVGPVVARRRVRRRAPPACRPPAGARPRTRPRTSTAGSGSGSPGSSTATTSPAGQPAASGPRRPPSTVTAPASISRCAAARDGDARAPGEGGVEALARRRRARSAARARSFRARRGGVAPRRCRAGSPRRPRWHVSAMLKAGQTTGSMKSITAPSRARSLRLPSAPPTSSPTGSHSRGIVACVQRSSRSAAPARRRSATRRSAPPPSSAPNATPVLRVLVMSRPKKTLALVPRLDRRDRDLLGHLVERDDHAGRGHGARDAARARAHLARG